MDGQTFINILFGMALVWHHFAIYSTQTDLYELFELIQETLEELEDAKARQEGDQTGEHPSDGVG